ncbi:MAG: type II toxin-antitoxin system RelE/ParE family toxin [Flavobacteriales bacterium]|nr:type II toxin-antitoxin system RelE/ParE family toxin [Flavobacteriales bacterium]
MILAFAQQAEDDLKAIEDDLSGVDAALVDLFNAEVIETLRYVLQFPRGYQVRFEKYRFAHLGAFQYSLIYSLEKDKIVVHRVRHMRQKPLKRYSA